jgi:hypothetical protein
MEHRLARKPGARTRDISLRCADFLFTSKLAPRRAEEDISVPYHGLGRSGRHGDRARLTPWDAAEPVASFLDEPHTSGFLERRLMARRCLIEILFPSSLVRTLFANGLAVRLACSGMRVLLLDGRNSREAVKAHVQASGATPDLEALKIVSQENCPLMMSATAWAQLPHTSYDIAIIDSINSVVEGIGEDGFVEPSRAIAPLFDICNREGGPAVLVLCDASWSAAHSPRLIENSADLVFTVSDATGFTPSGMEPWWQEVPALEFKASQAGERRTYCLAFTPSSYRIGEQPEPFVMEVDLTGEPWGLRDVTKLIEEEAADARRAQGREDARFVV